MKMVRMEEEERLFDFAKEAAEVFSNDDEVGSYSNPACPTEGEYFARRWGMDKDCVLVLKIDENFEPVIFQNIVKRKGGK